MEIWIGLISPKDRGDKICLMLKTSYVALEAQNRSPGKTEDEGRIQNEEGNTQVEQAKTKQETF